MNQQERELRPRRSRAASARLMLYGILLPYAVVAYVVVPRSLFGGYAWIVGIDLAWWLWALRVLPGVPRTQPHWRRGFVTALLGAGAAFAGYLAFLQLHGIRFGGKDPVTRIVADDWFLTACYVLVAPITEELVFRGRLFATLSVAGNRGLAIVETAVVFALMHVVAEQSFWGFEVRLWCGVVYGLVRVSGGSVIFPTVSHVFFNAAMLWK